MTRPRICSVVGVVWLYLGPAWLLIGGLGLYLYNLMHTVATQVREANATLAESGYSTGADVDLDIPFVFLWFPACVLLLGAFGLAGALGLLKSKEIARRTMVYVSYGTALLFIAFGIVWAYQRFTARHTGWEDAKTACLGLICSGLLAIPFLVMARKLDSRDIQAQTS